MKSEEEKEETDGAARKDKDGRRNPRTRNLLPTGSVSISLRVDQWYVDDRGLWIFAIASTNLDQCYLESASGVISIADAPYRHYMDAGLSHVSLPCLVLSEAFSR